MVIQNLKKNAAIVSKTLRLCCDAQRFLHSVEQHAADVGLFINAKKTEYMVVGRDAHIATSIRSQDGNNIARVEDFKYLGCWIRGSEKDVKVRMAIAWESAKRLSLVWRYQLDDKTKLAFFQAIVQSVLLYGCARRGH